MTARPDEPSTTVRIDMPTLVAIGLLLAPLTVMWHELVGHGGMCLAMGGHLVEVGAYYVDCSPLPDMPRRIVAMAGVWADIVAALAAWAIWHRVQSPLPRLVFWAVATSKALVAAGYFAFSGVTNVGDYAPAQGLAPMAHGVIIRLLLLVVGGLAYWRIILAASRGMSTMVGDDPSGLNARRRIALTLYVTIGAVAVFTGLFNPIGLFIMLMSAMASSLGGNAGLFTIAYSRPTGVARTFVLERNWIVIGLGVMASIAFAILLGPSIRPAG
jgi:hypothetical protein